MFVNRPNSKKSNAAALVLKAVVCYCLIFLITISVSLQQFAVYAKGFSPAFTKEISYQKNGHSNTGRFFSQLPASHNSFICFDIDVEVLEEEDLRNECTENCQPFAGNYVAGELLYTSSIRSRYLQMLSAFYNRTAVPFFILHHSWKEYLS